MNNSILTIMKKELARFFGDKKIVFSTILLPGILIYVMYSFMGTALTEQLTVDDDYKATCYVADMPEDASVQAMLKQTFSIKKIASKQELDRSRKRWKIRAQIFVWFFQRIL